MKDNDIIDFFSPEADEVLANLNILYENIQNIKNVSKEIEQGFLKLYDSINFWAICKVNFTFYLNFITLEFLCPNTWA